MKRLSPTVVILTVFILANVSFAGTYSGGSGTESQPYQIGNPGNWQELMTTSADWNQHFVLTADINLAGITLIPVGNSTINFTGVFDGNSHAMSNAVINQPSTNFIGLFGYVGSIGQVKNFGVENATMAGYGAVGGLIGYNDGNISNCYSTGVVNGSYKVGGLTGQNISNISNSYSTSTVIGQSGYSGVGGMVGENIGIISNCYSTGQVNGAVIVGGLAGYNDGNIINCHSTSQVSGYYLIGGLAGQNSDYGSIVNCYSTGQVSSSTGSSYTGGLSGDNGGIISNCYSTGQVNGGDLDVGGLVGENFENGSIINCYSASQVSGLFALGGLVGQNEGSISNCYSVGHVNYSYYHVGGLVGFNDTCGSVLSSFWDMQSSGQFSSDGGTGKYSFEMMTESTFTDAGWDFTNETANGTNDYWRMCVNGVDYPHLNWEYAQYGDFACPDGVAFTDFAYFAKWWQTTGCDSSNNFCGDTDIDSSGTVDIEDFEIMATNWLQRSYVIIANFDFDTDPGWTTEGQWQFGPSMGMGGRSYGYPDPPYGGRCRYGVSNGSNGDYTVAVGGPYSLTTGPLDCSNYATVEISFARWLNTDIADRVQCKVEASNDGSTWQTVWSNPTTVPITDNQWLVVKYDISQIAAGYSQVYIRWSYQILSDMAYPYSGWNIDYVKLLGLPSYK